MKRAAIGFLSVGLVTLGAWLFAFGVMSPCDALQAEVHKLSDLKDARSRGIADALGGANGKALSSTECFALAVRIKALGAGGVTVVGPGAGAARPATPGK